MFYPLVYKMAWGMVYNNQKGDELELRSLYNLKMNKTPAVCLIQFNPSAESQSIMELN